jgi:hypothetical protein
MLKLSAKKETDNPPNSCSIHPAIHHSFSSTHFHFKIH